MTGSVLWSHRASWAGDLRHVAEARAFVARHLVENGLISEVDTVVMVISELATNAVVHARTPFSVTLWRNNGSLGVAVGDLSSRQPIGFASGSLLDEGGRGLMMVAWFSSTWGITPLVGGKSVWANFDLVDEPAPHP